MQVLRQDIRYATRSLLRQRGTSIVEALTLALGIGASTAIFSVVDAAMLRPLPYRSPEQLVTVGVGATSGAGRHGCLAALVPAMRAARVDPVATLRAE